MIVIPNIVLDYGEIGFSFDLKNDIIVVNGDSGTGKSMFCDVLNNTRKMTAKNSLKDVVTVFNEDNPLEIGFLFRKKKHLFVIDNADILLTDEIVDHIAYDINNQYLIFARGPWCFQITPNCFAEVIFNDGLKKYELKYFKIPGWKKFLVSNIIQLA